MLKALRQNISGLASSVVRFPVTAAFLLASAVLISVSIGGEDELTRYILAAITGALACAAVQMLYERFFTGMAIRMALYAAGVAVTALFFWSVYALPDNGTELFTRFSVTMLALFIAFIWAGVIKEPRGFAESFIAAFKAVFESAFFSGVLFLGCALIIAAVDRLITPVDGDAYAHTANIVFTVIAPFILLSLIPVYPGRAQNGAMTETQRELLDRRTGCPKFLEILLSYIIIPLTGIFTVILLVYILLNIGGNFWTDNLLEPMLIAYTLVVIVVTLLVSRLENRMAVLFVQIFPKVMIPIAVFQIIASALLLEDTGLTFGRYYVLLYGAFAVFAGVALSFAPRVKIGVIAPVLIVLSVLSLIPPVDAFTVSLASQTATLERTLEANGMLSDDTLTPDGDIPSADKTRIIASVEYLSEMDKLNTLIWLPDGFTVYDDAAFSRAFGFSRYDAPPDANAYISVYYNNNEALPITGFDAFAELYVPDSGKTGHQAILFEAGGKNCVLSVAGTDGGAVIVTDSNGTELIRFETSEIINRFAQPEKSELTLTEATFSVENELAALKAVVLNADFKTQPTLSDVSARLYVFVAIK